MCDPSYAVQSTTEARIFPQKYNLEDSLDYYHIELFTMVFLQTFDFDSSWISFVNYDQSVADTPQHFNIA